MSDSPHPFDFGKFIPGFDFLQQLTADGKGAAPAIPGLGGWLAPTVNVEELDKRIAELKAVLFWLEQNGTALKATIQALEVQKMTLATLAGMNLSMAEVAKAFTLPPQGAPTAAPVAAAAPEHWPFATAPAAPEPAPAPKVAAQPDAPAREAAASQPAAPARQRKPAAAPAPAAAGMADPMQWWGALTQQFQQIAANAMRDAAPAAMAAMTAMAGPDAKGASATGAQDTPRKPAARKASAKKAASKSAASAARKAPVKKAAKKAATQKAAARKPAKPAAAPTDGGWPLPPPFKLGR